MRVLSREELADILAVKRKHEKTILQLPNVVSVGVGSKCVGGVRREGEAAIQVLVSKKQPMTGASAIPTELEGFLTDVVEVGDVKNLGEIRTVVDKAVTQMQPTRPLVGGVSVGPDRTIGDNLTMAGTLGAVFPTTKGPVGLSNFHVLCMDNHWQLGNPIVQPSLVDAFGNPPYIIGSLCEASLDHIAGVPGNVDAAICTISGVDSVPLFVENIGHIKGVTSPGLFTPLRKMGRTTGLTYGFVDGLDHSWRFSGIPGYGAYTLTNLFLVYPMLWKNFTMADHGDSGSLLIDDDNRVAGLLFGMGIIPPPSWLFVNEFTDVQKVLGINLNFVEESVQISIPVSGGDFSYLAITLGAHHGTVNQVATCQDGTTWSYGTAVGLPAVGGPMSSIVSRLFHEGAMVLGVSRSGVPYLVCSQDASGTWSPGQEIPCGAKTTFSRLACEIGAMAALFVVGLDAMGYGYPIASCDYKTRAWTAAEPVSFGAQTFLQLILITDPTFLLFAIGLGTDRLPYLVAQNDGSTWQNTLQLLPAYAGSYLELQTGSLGGITPYVFGLGANDGKPYIVSVYQDGQWVAGSGPLTCSAPPCSQITVSTNLPHGELHLVGLDTTGRAYWLGWVGPDGNWHAGSATPLPGVTYSTIAAPVGDGCMVLGLGSHDGRPYVVGSLALNTNTPMLGGYPLFQP